MVAARVEHFQIDDVQIIEFADRRQHQGLRLRFLRHVAAQRLVDAPGVGAARLPEQVDTALFCADLMRPPAPAAGSPVEPTADEARTIQAAAALEAGAVFQVTLDDLTQALREAKAKACRQER